MKRHTQEEIRRGFTTGKTVILNVDNPVTNRPCRGCNMCCSAPAINSESLRDVTDMKPKKACEVCEFSTDYGCSRYNTRPNICRGYKCLWSLGIIPTSNYPMRRGVCWTLIPCEVNIGEIILIGHANDVDSILVDERSLNVANYFINLGHPYGNVVIRDDNKVIHLGSDGKGSTIDVDQDDYLKARVKVGTEVGFNFEME